MNNNDILIRLRYALDIKNTDMVEIFKLGGIELTVEEVKKILIKPKDSCDDEVTKHGDIEQKKDNIECNHFMLESFLNGFIIFKRGVKDPKPGQTEKPVLPVKDSDVNNVMLKKLKIALELSSDDVIDLLKEAGVMITKSELSALFRKEGHKNYKACGDKYAKNFLKGLAIKNRSNDIH
jgi:uncharacterized protein YehS (DUF1456 family)